MTPQTIMVPVTSSDIEAIGYDSTLEIMDIKFKKTGRSYRFYNVGHLVHTGLMSAASKSVYFSRNIKNYYKNHPL